MPCSTITKMVKWTVCAAVVAMLAACSPFGGGGAFNCTSDQQCSGAGGAGTCQPNGFCSFADGACTSGQRYGDLSGGLSNVCVGDEPPDAAVVVDAKPDIFIPPGDTCYGSGLVTVCFMAPVTGTITVNTDINTDDPGGTVCNTMVDGTNPNCVITGDTITIAANVSVTGSKPLVFVAATSITVNNGVTIDAASHRTPAKIGPSADFASCNAGTAPAANGGGAGGSFGGTGGNGGGKSANGGTAGAAIANPATLHGGCPGQAGSANAAAGHGGGAIFFIAGSSITVSGTINASGAPGSPGVTGQAGGGAGGSGGLIGFDALTITATGGTIFASGGGGGEASGATTMGGAPPSEPTATTAPPGAGGSTSGGDGGAGACNGAVNGTVGGTGTGLGGGGGGGSSGVIKANQTITGGVVFPQPS
jgi:hypothetical protein